MNFSRIALTATLSLAVLPAVAQPVNQVEWKQVINMPKGTNLPLGVRADMLGIELGDSYAEAKAKLTQLAAEGVQPKPDKRSFTQRSIDRSMGAGSRPPISETETYFRLEGGASKVTAAAYVSQVKMQRELPGSGTRSITEGITLYLSAPSSGHQVIGIERFVSYPTDADQPRLTDLLGSLKEKFRSNPRVEEKGSYTSIKLQFDNGKLYFPPPRIAECSGGLNVTEADKIAWINKEGDCDVLVTVTANHGISRDHASALRFLLADNERAKANLTADFKFFDDYVNDLQNRTRGAPPKL